MTALGRDMMTISAGSWARSSREKTSFLVTAGHCDLTPASQRGDAGEVTSPGVCYKSLVTRHPDNVSNRVLHCSQ